MNKSTAFDADPTSVGFGDLAVKGAFRVPPAGATALSAYLEIKLPTAASATLGTGKVVATPGGTAGRALPWTSAGRSMTVEVELSANVSVAGDPDRAAVGYAALELKLAVPCSARTRLQLVAKPSWDWANGGETAGVAELTGEWTPDDWRLALKLGRRLWGGPVGGSYDDKVELAVRRQW